MDTVKYSFLKLFLLGSLLILASPFAVAQCIGVVTAGGGQGFWADVGKGARQAGQELGLAVYVRGAVDESNIAAQRSLINVMIDKGCTGLVLAPNTKERQNDVEILKAQGIPTVFIDRDIGGDRVSVIKTNNFRAGQLAGKEMVKALNGKGQVAVLRSNKNIPTTTSRERGFIKEAINGGLEVTVDYYLGTMIGDARSRAFEIFDSADHIDGVFTPNEVTTMATIAALGTTNDRSLITHIGFDSSDYMVKALQSDQIFGFVVQRPFDMGYQGVYTVHQVMLGNNVDKNIDTNVIFVNKDKLVQTEIKQVLGIN
ncbi:hypothetical protein A9Q78_08375 [Methylophaga sp. 41_12_T18]|nr:hypothetical protein A9Q78_08375 [Methylophaga sp. 41_12_T18]